jgi:DNA-binding NarL/FixJ family response regulator
LAIGERTVEGVRRLATSTATLLLRCAGDALTASEAFEPRLVLLDIDLPDLSSYDLLDELEARCSEPRPLFVAITGWPDVARSSLAAGFDRCLIKPVSLHQFLEIIELAEKRTACR